ncbi:MAG: arsenosugar biosynthesis radical SAM protein ArsS [Thermodesulfovibrionia bacterium]|nr:arsenosugar biosynthesis radical SAM protein ArsS [Thermodesulfovibrionia bacterium]
MNDFDNILYKNGQYPLTADSVSTLQVNMGYKCNLRCTHCHIEASPDRKEMMSLKTMTVIHDILINNENINTVDITGGSPELNPYYKYFIQACRNINKNIIVRTNLAVLTEPGKEDIPDFLAEIRVKIVASLPCYTEEGVDSQRGKGTYNKAITALKKLNALGYGKEGTGLVIDIMFNPAGAAAAPDQKMLENAYREKLKEMHGVTFNNLIALSNMPIGRLGRSMPDHVKDSYVKELKDKFNPATVNNLMCRHLISVSPDGRLFDCDFWQVFNLNIRTKLDTFDYETLSNRKILTSPLCFMCTAGAGASCGGALA